jgi:hypothetical protein
LSIILPSEAALSRAVARRVRLVLVTAGVLAATAFTPAAVAGPNSPTAVKMLRVAIPVAEYYYSTQGTYVGLTMAKLRQINPRMSTVEISWVRRNSYCFQVNVLGSWAHVRFNGRTFAWASTRCPRS